MNCWDIPISDHIPPALTTALVLMVLAIAATPYLSGQNIGPLAVPKVSRRTSRVLFVAGPFLVIAVSLLLFVPLEVILHQNCNRIQNPSAEMLVGEGASPTPLYWTTSRWFQTGRIEVASDRAHSGSKSFKLSAVTVNTLNWRQPVHLQPHSTYMLSAWIFAEGVKPSIQDNDRGANIAIHFTDKFPQSSDRILDTAGKWVFASLQFTTGKEMTDAYVELQLGAESGMTTGTAWFDDVTLEKLY